jgi:hypothetical protein
MNARAALDATRTDSENPRSRRELSNEIEISHGQSVLANTLHSFRGGAVGFIDLLSRYPNLTNRSRLRGKQERECPNTFVTSGVATEDRSSSAPRNRLPFSFVFGKNGVLASRDV